MKAGWRAFALTFALACTLLPVTSGLLGKEGTVLKKSVETELVSLHGNSNVGTNVEGMLNGLEDFNASDGTLTLESSGRSKAGRRRRRAVKSGATKSRRRRRGKSSTSTSRRRRRGKSSTSTSRRRRRGGSAPKPAATKADASPQSIEAGWGDLAKMGEFFTLFISGSGLDPQKDRALVIHGSDKCGSSSARVATVLGSGDVPSGVKGWASLKCNGLTASSSKLACGDGESNGVKFPDDKWVDTYNFKVCVCDYSKKNRCSSKSDFDTTPSKSTLKVNPVV